MRKQKNNGIVSRFRQSTLVIIRFNPDKYDEQKGCFKLTKTGSLSLNKKEWNTRISQLCKYVNIHVNNIPKKELTVEYYFIQHNTIAIDRLLAFNEQRRI